MQLLSWPFKLNNLNNKYCYIRIKVPLCLLVILLVSNRIFAQPVAAFTANKVTGCAPLTVLFTDQSTGTPFAWNWDLGNGQLSTVQNPGVTYSNPGVYSVRLVVRNASGIDEEIKTNYIVVSASPVAAFSANITTACNPATVQFTDNSVEPPNSGNIVSWLWDFGDGNTSTQRNPTHVYSTTGFFTVALTVTSTTGCVGVSVAGRYIRVVDGVDVNFSSSPSLTCKAPYTISFTDQSSGPGAFTYDWNFGNGSPNSNLPNPTGVYNTAGTFPVTLNVQSSLGCGGTLTKNVVIPANITDFTAPASGCVGKPITFTNASSPTPVSTNWDFGDGTTSSQVNPVKTYLAAGNYSVMLINGYGNCLDTIIKLISVASKPPVDFTVNDNNSCAAPFTVQFTDASPAANSWLWDFGDGTTSTQQNPSHTYTSFGRFNVTLTIGVSGGCDNTITKNSFIEVAAASVSISNAPGGGCIPFTFSPVAAIQTVDPVVSYAWDFGDAGATSTSPTPTHTYANAGNYVITLTVTTQSGCTATTTAEVHTGSLPTVDFSFLPVTSCARDSIRFTDLSSTTPGATVTWLWDFGDGNSSSVQSPAHKFTEIGPLDVTLTVINNGCPNSITKQVTVLPPIAKFGYTVDCANPRNVTFSDSSKTDGAYGAIQYTWIPDIANPTTQFIFTPPAAPPAVTYSSFGTFTSSLIVSNGACADTVTRQVVLPDLSPQFVASKNPVCRNEPFTLTATNANPAFIRSYTWIVNGNTLPDTTATVNAILTANGVYDVTLITTDVNGCQKTQTIPQYLTVRGPQANFTAAAGACVAKAVTFTDLSTPVGTIVSWSFDFGDGQQQTFAAPPFTHTYTEEGAYYPLMTIRDVNGCGDARQINAPVLITNPKADFKADTVFCPQTPLQFTDYSTGNITDYAWSFGDGGTDIIRNPLHSYPAGDNQYSVKLRIRDVAGCEDSITKTGYIKIRAPKAAFDIADTAGICLPLQTSFTFKGSDYKELYWDFGDGTSSTLKDPRHFYNTYGDFVPKLYLIGPGGCIDSAAAAVHVYNPGTVVITNNPTEGCNSVTTTLTFTPPPGIKFETRFGDGKIDSSGQTTLVHTYNSPGLYDQFLFFTEKSGCQAISATSTVRVLGTIPLFGKNRKEFCDNGEVFFTNFTISNEPILSSVWDFGDGTTSTDNDPSHIYSAPGTYIVSLNTVTQSQCASSFYDTIRVYRTPEVSISGKDTICINTTETFNGLVAVADTLLKWNWNFANGTSSVKQNDVISYATAGNYNIQLIAANKLGCSDTAYHTVTVAPLPTAIATVDPLQIISGASIPLNMTYTGPITNYTWTPNTNLSCFNCSTPVASPRSTTTYRVQVRDRYGCSNTGNITVKVVCSNENFFIPNTFSPNGDGSNDRFYPRGTGLYSIKALRIFNRWGEIVFEKRDFAMNDASQGWDGMYKGKKAPADVYVYQAEIFCNNGELVKYSGNVALIL